ncbi:MAG: cupin domain-containing protein [Chloroflexi bacterium]|nr:cupin domain-containing protein [Chloroflexota bacterium]
MVEKLSERKKENEPEETLYDQSYRLTNEEARKREQGRVIIKGKDIPFQQSRQALLRYLLHQKDWDSVAVPNWSVFINRIKVHSGRHVHQGGICLYVLEGKGYTIVDGVKFPWKKNDLILLPIKPGGVEHQHFNEDPNEPCEWIAFHFRPMGNAAAHRLEQREEHPDWAKSK